MENDIQLILNTLNQGDLTSYLKDISNQQDAIAKHNIDVTESGNNNFLSQTGNAFGLDIAGAVSVLGHLVGSSSLENAGINQMQNLNKNEMFNETGTPDVGMAQELTNMALQGAFFGGSLGLIEKGASSLAKKFVTKEIKREIDENILAGTASKLPKIGKDLFDNSVISTEFGLSGAGGSMRASEQMNSNGDITIPKATNEMIGLNMLGAVVPTAALLGFTKAFKVSANGISNAKMIHSLKSSKYAVANEDLVFALNTKQNASIMQEFEAKYGSELNNISKDKYNALLKDFADSKGVTHFGLLKTKDGVTVDEIRTNEVGGFIDKNNNVLIQSPKIGKLRGKLVDVNGSPQIIIDSSKSSFKKIGYKINDNPILAPYKEGEAFINKPFDINGDKAHRTNGFEYNTKNGKTTTTGSYTNSAEDNQILKDINNASKKTDINNKIDNQVNPESGSNYKRTFTSQAILHEDNIKEPLIKKMVNSSNNEIKNTGKVLTLLKKIKNSTTEGFKVLNNYMNQAIDNIELDKVFKKALDTGDTIKANSSKNTAFNMFFKDIQASKNKNQEIAGSKNISEINAKEQFTNTLKNVAKLKYAEFGLKHLDKKIEEQDVTDLASSIVNTTFDIMGKNHDIKTNHYESLKQELTKAVKEQLVNIKKLNPEVKSKTPKEPMALFEKVIVNDEEPTTYRINKDFNTALTENAKGIDADTLTQIGRAVKYKPEGIHLNVKGRVDYSMHPSLISSSTTEMANRMANQSYTIHDIEKVKADIERFKQLDDKGILQLLDKEIKDYDIDTNSDGVFAKQARSTIDEFKRKLNELEDFVNNYDGSDIKFDTQIMDNNRIRYNSILSPQDDKILRHIIIPKDVKEFDKTNVKDVELFQRHIIDEFGDKPVTDLKTPEEVNSEFAKTEAKLRVKRLQHKDTFLENKALEYIDNYKQSDGNFFALAEVDGTNNGFANIMATLGSKESGVGIGSNLDKNKALYDTVQQKLNSMHNLSLDRKTVKYGTLSSLYGSGSKNITKTIVEAMIQSDKKSALKLLDDYFDYTKLHDLVDEKFANKIEKVKRLNSLIDQYQHLVKTNDITKALKLKKSIIKDILKHGKNKAKTSSGIVIEDLYDAYNKMSEGKDLLQKEYDAVNRVLQNKLEKSIGSIIDEVLPKEFKDTFEIFEAMNTKASMKFLTRINERIDNIDNLLKELNSSKYKDIIQNKKELNKLYFDNAKYLSYKDVIEKLLDNDIIRAKDISRLDFISEKIPYINNPFNEKVFLIKLDSIGYDKEFGMRFQTLAPRDLSFVIHNLSIDASIIKQLKDNQLPLYDAVFGGSDIVETTKAMNQQLAKVYKDYNIYVPIKDTLDKFGSLTQEEFDKSINELANIRVLKNKKPYETITKEYMNAKRTKEIETIQKRFKKVTSNVENSKNKFDIVQFDKEFNDRVNEKLKATDTLKKNIKESNIIDQYSVGGDLTRTTVGERPKDYKYKSIPKQDKYHFGNFSDTNLKYVITPDKLREQDFKIVTSFSQETSKQTAPSSIKVVFDPSAKTSSFANNVVTINSKDVTPDTFVSILHEIMHKNTGYTSAEQPLIYKELSDWFSKKFPELNNYLDTKSIKNNGDEALTHIMSELMFNELLHTNKDLFAYLFKKDGEQITNLSQYLRTSDNSQYMKYVESELNSNIITTKDLYKYIQDNSGDEINSKLQNQFANLARETSNLFNSDTTLGSWLRNKSLKDFTPVTEGKANKALDKFVSKILDGRSEVKTQSEKISNLGLFEIFQIDANKEALEKVMAINNGANQKLDRMSSVFNEEIINQLEDLSKTLGQDRTIIDRHLGNSVMLGLNQFVKLGKFKDIRFTNAKTVLEDVNKIIEDFTNNKINTHTKSNLELQKAIDAISKKFADGKVAKVNDISKKMEKIVKKALNENHIDYRSKEGLQLIDDISTVIKLKASYNRLKVFGDSLNDMTKIFSNGESKQLLENHLTTFNRFANKNTLFGENIYLDLYAKNNTLKMVQLKKGTKLKGKPIATIYQGEDTFVIVLEEQIKQLIGNQQSQIFDYNPRDFEKGIYKVFKGKKSNRIELFINGQNVNTSHKFVDASYSKMLQRNFYLGQKQDLTSDILFRQFKIMKDQGLLLTKEDYNNLDLESRKQYMKLDKGNPITEMYGSHYYNKKYSHYLEGSKGLNPYKLVYSVTDNKQISKFLANSTRLLVDSIRILRGVVLVSRPSSYINSFISSWVVALIHGVDHKSITMAKSLFNDYKAKNQEYIRLMLEDTNKANKYYQNTIKNHELYSAFEHGIAQTVRTDAYKLGLHQSNEVYKMFEKHLNSRGAEIMKMVTLDPSTNIGAKLGNVFDNTEMIPKIALYLSQKEKTNSELASQYVTMAFPTYNNLNPVLNAVDQFIPYTKYWFNVPKMLLFAGEKNPRRLLINQFLMYGIPMASYSGINGDSNSWYEKRGFTHLFGKEYLYTNSWNPYNLFDFAHRIEEPSKQGFGFDTLTSLYDVTPWTTAN